MLNNAPLLTSEKIFSACANRIRSLSSFISTRMYYWAQAFKERYPNDMKVYYESEDFVCYVMPQNMYHQYNFAIDYGYNQFRTQEDKN